MTPTQREIAWNNYLATLLKSSVTEAEFRDIAEAAIKLVDASVDAYKLRVASFSGIIQHPATPVSERNYLPAPKQPAA